MNSETPHETIFGWICGCCRRFLSSQLMHKTPMLFSVIQASGFEIASTRVTVAVSESFLTVMTRMAEVPWKNITLTKR